MAPAACCKAIGPSSNMPLRSFAVVWPLRTAVMSRPFAVTSYVFHLLQREGDFCAGAHFHQRMPRTGTGPGFEIVAGNGPPRFKNARWRVRRVERGGSRQFQSRDQRPRQRLGKVYTPGYR
jgi:hypothetical protein